MGQKPSVVILGAGIQGACAALAIAHLGKRVLLIDQEPGCMLRASLANEGKVHLGFVYAADRSRRTPELMLDGALSFAPLLEKWARIPVPWDRFRSRPFVYCVIRGSMLSVDRLRESYAALEESYQVRRGSGGANYLGTQPARLWRDGDDLDPEGLPFSDRVVHWMETEEVSLDTHSLRALVAGVLEGTVGVDTLYGHEVRSLTRSPIGFRVEGVGPGGDAFEVESENLVNCLWERRLYFDQQLGILPPRAWIHRLKCRVRGRLPPDLRGLPSLTCVLGPFGDVVTHHDGRINMSWYPVCRRAWSDALMPPEDWEAICRRRPDPATVESISRETRDQFDLIVPGIRDVRVDAVEGGVIFSWGRSDIDDPDSELHTRDDIGVAAHDGYFSINTGKFTMAPLFAQQLADQIS